MLSELRLATRSLATSRGFALTAILTLAVGIGATTAIFSALRALVISPFHYPAEDRLVQVWSGENWSLSPADFLDLHEQSASFVAFGVSTQLRQCRPGGSAGARCHCGDRGCPARLRRATGARAALRRHG